MKLLRRFLSPPSSLVLVYHHLGAGMDEIDEFEAQLDEVGQFYQWVKLGDLVDGLKKGKVAGMASLVFAEARKGTLLKALPVLRGREIPMTFFLHVDCIGFNRLPLDEELALYRVAYPDRVPASLFEELRRQAWESPEEVEGLLTRWRKEIGPLPVQQCDPTRFFATWGNILEAAPGRVDFGLNVQSSPEQASLRSALTFIRQQSKQPVRLALCDRALSTENQAQLRSVGIEGLVGVREGAVEKGTDPMDLPRWKWEKHASAEE